MCISTVQLKIYKANYSDLANYTGEQLVRHFVKIGRLEGRNATTLIQQNPHRQQMEYLMHIMQKKIQMF